MGFGKVWALTCSGVDGDISIVYTSDMKTMINIKTDTGG